MKSIRISSNCIYLLLIAACVLSSGGCNDSALPLVPVRGKITFAGNAPPSKGFITFIPLEIAAGLPNRPGQATFNTDGTYEVTSFDTGDGLIPGKYGINIACWKNATSDSITASRYSYVKPGFAAPPVVVDAGKSELVVDLDVPLNAAPK